MLSTVTADQPATRRACSARARNTRTEPGEPVEDRIEPDAQLEAREVHTEALVRARAERDLLIGRARKIEPVRRFEFRGVAIG